MLPVRRKVSLQGVHRRVDPSSGYSVNVLRTRPRWSPPSAVTAAASAQHSMGRLVALQKKQHGAPYCA